MDNNIVQTVYDSLEAATTEMDKTKDEYAAIEAKIKAGRYSSDVLQKEIYPKRDALRQKIYDDSERAINAAKGLVNQYRQDAARLNDLDPAELTDDVKLFQTGVPLLERDIRAILERNKDNRTMTQLALRYAKEHGINLKGTYYIGGNTERTTADNLDGVIEYYSRWIDKDNAHDMLRKFFGMSK